MKVLGAMNSHLESSGRQILTHLKDALLDFFAILGVEDVLLELVAIYFLGLSFIRKHQKRLIVAPK